MEGVPPIRPIELMLDENITNVEFKDFIGVWDGLMPAAVCKQFTDWMGTLKDQYSLHSADIQDNVGDGRFQFHNGSLGRNDNQILLNHNNHELTKVAHQYIQSALEHYIFEYGQLRGQGLISTSIKMQHTPEGGGYHQFHYEAMGLDHSSRVLVWAIYLNDDYEGGETEFLHQKRRIKANQGTLVIWPAGYTHVHKGNLVLKGDKYILTGWYLLNS